MLIIENLIRRPYQTSLVSFGSSHSFESFSSIFTLDFNNVSKILKMKWKICKKINLYNWKKLQERLIQTDRQTRITRKTSVALQETKIHSYDQLVLTIYSTGKSFICSPLWKFWNSKTIFFFILHWRYLGLRSEDECETKDNNFSFYFLLFTSPLY